MQTDFRKIKAKINKIEKLQKELIKAKQKVIKLEEQIKKEQRELEELLRIDNNNNISSPN